MTNSKKKILEIVRLATDGQFSGEEYGLSLDALAITFFDGENPHISGTRLALFLRDVEDLMDGLFIRGTGFDEKLIIAYRENDLPESYRVQRACGNCSHENGGCAEEWKCGKNRDVHVAPHAICDDWERRK